MTDDSKKRKGKAESPDVSGKPVDKIETDKPVKVTMSVPEMRAMLGLKKTESYWLVHKEYFKTIEVSGHMRILIDSFEEWYANQVKYFKVDGTPPGEEVKKRSYSPRDIADMLEISEDTVYDIIRRENIPTIEVDYWKRVERDVFQNWYLNQDHYRTKEDRMLDKELEETTMTMPQMAWFLDVPRRTIYDLLKTDIDLETVMIAGKRHVTVDSFWRWYAKQDKYEIRYKTLKQSNQEHAKHVYDTQFANFKKRAEENGENWGGGEYQKKYKRISDRGLAYSRNVTKQKKMEEKKITERKDEVINGVMIPAGGRDNGDTKRSNSKYYSVEEVMELTGLSKRTVWEKIRRNQIPAVKVARTFRIPKAEFDQLMKK